MDIEKLRSKKSAMIGKTITHKTCSYNLVESEKSTIKSVLESDDSDYDFVAVVNSTNVIDSHSDLHLDGLWNEKSFNGLSYVLDHDFSVSGLIAQPSDVKALVRRMDWNDLGVNSDGKTDALLYYVKLRDYANPDFVRAYKNGVTLQNSVRMRYEVVHLAVNNKDFKEEYANWNKYLKFAINPEKAIEDGYFFAVEKASLFLESSAVLRGSNQYTPLLEKQVEEKQVNTQSPEVGDKATQEVNNSYYSYYKTIH